MSSAPVRHPDDRLLVAFQLSKLDQRQIAIVNKHLQECRECRQRLARLGAEMEIPTAPLASTPPAVTVRAPRRRANLLWLAAGAFVALFGLSVAWAVGAFSERPGTDAESTVVTTKEQTPQATSPSLAVKPTAASRAEIQPPATELTKPAPIVAKADSKSDPASPFPKSSDRSPPAAASAATPQPTAAESPPAATANAAAEFFDGKNLAGWKGAGDMWRVENGAIVGTLSTPRKQPAFLCSQKRFGDFDLMFRVTIEGGIGDCGVQFRSLDRTSEQLPVAGPMCAIYGKDPPGDHRTGSLVSEPGHKVEKAPSAQRVERFVDPTENHFRIRCQGKHILIEVNGVKMVNGEFPSLPDEGIIAWKLDASRPPHKVTFKILKFTDLSGASPSESAARPSLSDLELLRAEIKFESAVKKADETLLSRFEPEIARLKRASRAKEKDLVDAVEHEKERFKSKGFVPFSRPMRKWLLQYGKELRDAERSLGSAFDTAIERAKKSRNERLEEALVAEAAQVLAPREVARWEFTDRHRVVRRSFYSDGTFVESDSKSGGEPRDESGSRFWSPPVDDVLVLEFPDPKDPAATNQQAFEVAADGKTLIAQSDKGQKELWRHVDEPDGKAEPQQQSGQ